MNNDKSRCGAILAYLYMLIPTLIFCITWLKIQYAIIATIILIVSFVCMCKHAPKMPFKTKKNGIVVVIIIIALVWVYLSGIGGYTYQNTDHHYRNAIFSVLVENDWPVVKQQIMDSGIEDRGLTYYIGFWLPAALLGKVFGLEAGFLFQYIWAIAGVLIVFYLISCTFKKISIWPIVIFIFFGGLDLLGSYATGYEIDKIIYWNHIEWWTELQYTSITAQLFWVFNQALPAWIGMFLLMQQKDNKNLLFIFSLCLINCPLPAIGMIPFLIYFAIKNECGREKIKTFKDLNKLLIKLIKGVLSIQNIIGGIFIALIMCSYFFGNSAAVNTTSLQRQNNTNCQIMQWLTSIFFEVIIYFVIIKKYQKSNIYYVALVWLILCPLFKVGAANDFCMRASIPALLVLYILTVQALQTAIRNKEKINSTIIIILLCISSITAIFEINRTITNTLRKNYEIIILDERRILTEPNFSSNSEENIFFKYFASK